jgi:hypothetical protein
MANWEARDRHWKHLFKLQDPTDRELFFSSSYIQIGDGKNTLFWEAKWLHGAAPKDIAPNIYRRTRFKKRLVHTELHNNNWIRSIGLINDSVLLNEYVLLFLMISSVSLTNEKDAIRWRWTSSGKFTVASAYKC